jgi:hypothetical protein
MFQQPQSPFITLKLMKASLKAQCLLYVPPGLKFTNSTYIHNVFTRFICFLEHTVLPEWLVSFLSSKGYTDCLPL